jgi:hypothetical protein
MVARRRRLRITEVSEVETDREDCVTVPWEDEREWEEKEKA